MRGAWTLLFRGSDNLALAPLCTLNPLGIAFEPFKPKEIASFGLMKGPAARLPQVLHSYNLLCLTINLVAQALVHA